MVNMTTKLKNLLNVKYTLAFLLLGLIVICIYLFLGVYISDIILNKVKYFSLFKEFFLNNIHIIVSFYSKDMYHLAILIWNISILLLIIYNFINQRSQRKEKENKNFLSFLYIILINLKNIIIDLFAFIKKYIYKFIVLIFSVWVIGFLLSCFYYFIESNKDNELLYNYIKLFTLGPIVCIIYCCLKDYIFNGNVKFSDIILYLKTITIGRFIFIASIYSILVYLDLNSILLSYFLWITNEVILNLKPIISNFIEASLTIVKSHSYINGLLNKISFISSKEIRLIKGMSYNNNNKLIIQNKTFNSINKIKLHDFYHNLLFEKLNYTIKSPNMVLDKNYFLNKKFWISKPICLDPLIKQPPFNLIKTNNYNATNLYVLLPLKNNKIIIISTSKEFIHWINNLNPYKEKNSLKELILYNKFSRLELENKNTNLPKRIELYENSSKYNLVLNKYEGNKKLEIISNKNLLSLNSKELIISKDVEYSYMHKFSRLNQLLSLSNKNDDNINLNWKDNVNYLGNSPQITVYMFHTNIPRTVIPIVGNIVPMEQSRLDLQAINSMSIDTTINKVHPDIRNLHEDRINLIKNTWLSLVLEVNKIKHFFRINNGQVSILNNKLILPSFDGNLIKQIHCMNLLNIYDATIDNLIRTLILSFHPDLENLSKKIIKWLYLYIGTYYPLSSVIDIINKADKIKESLSYNQTPYQNRIVSWFKLPEMNPDYEDFDSSGTSTNPNKHQNVQEDYEQDDFSFNENLTESAAAGPSDLEGYIQESIYDEPDSNPEHAREIVINQLTNPITKENELAVSSSSRNIQNQKDLLRSEKIDINSNEVVTDNWDYTFISCPKKEGLHNIGTCGSIEVTNHSNKLIIKNIDMPKEDHSKKISIEHKIANLLLAVRHFMNPSALAYSQIHKSKLSPKMLKMFSDNLDKQGHLLISNKLIDSLIKKGNESSTVIIRKNFTEENTNFKYEELTRDMEWIHPFYVIGGPYIEYKGNKIIPCPKEVGLHTIGTSGTIEYRKKNKTVVIREIKIFDENKISPKTLKGRMRDLFLAVVNNQNTYYLHLPFLSENVKTVLREHVDLGDDKQLKVNQELINFLERESL